MATLVSIIIPTHNRVDLVGEAIESALRQTYAVREVIVIDDGSADGTADLLAGYGDRIRAIRTSNRGCAAARNTGVALARGAYLAFLDSDDVLLPDKLDLQVPVLDAQDDVGFVYGPIVVFGPELVAEHLDTPIRPTAERSVAEGLFLTTRVGFGSVLLRRAAVNQAGGFDETLRYNEDTDLLLRVALNWKAVCIEAPTVRQRWHSGRKSRDEVALQRAVLRSMQQVLDARPEFRVQLGARAEARLAEVHWAISRALAERNEIAAARAEAAAAWRHRHSFALAAWRTILTGPGLAPVALRAGRLLARGLGFLQVRLRGI